jgi:ATP-dependent RNA helicase DeaD
MDIGRRHNADPRWLLPLLCRRGHITKNEIGAIRITAAETMFEIPRAAAGRFAAAVSARRRADGDGRVAVEAVDGQAPRRRPREPPRHGPPPRAATQAKPTRRRQPALGCARLRRILVDADACR